jgi:hypothetical protein
MRTEALSTAACVVQRPFEQVEHSPSTSRRCPFGVNRDFREALVRAASIADSVESGTVKSSTCPHFMHTR